MSADTTPSDRQTTVGVDAVSLERYSAVQTDDLQLIVYDELIDDAWIQSTDWIDALAMA
ncbi:hypothetical protein [Natrinema sp. 1APR25-10V2]|uniref:hypothetical protein n=1 Tax=Natrinema sp. 1APR25-10V2 TaxID=2951081 RepID=UPI00287552F5|nr:hypothetical protein [Natrinema sp. 1APR25-10V2]MDS0475529.1 hypothetical protein [Natrinema sp. 1APR25-10V2]